jgi:hypothetical protein
MRHDIPSSATTVVQIAQSVHPCVGRLLQKRLLDEAARDDFTAARSMLEALPLSTDEFGLACTRLQNAQHYLNYTEPGAAWYELRMLVSSLKHGQLHVPEPRRRLRHRT